MNSTRELTRNFEVKGKAWAITDRFNTEPTPAEIAKAQRIQKLREDRCKVFHETGVMKKISLADLV